MEDSIDLEMLDYDGWSDLEEEEVSARKRRRYSPVRDEGGHTTGIELVTVENDPEALAPPSSSPAVLTPERSSESSTLTSLPSTLTPTPGSPAPCQSIVTLASSTTTVITSLPPPCTVKSSSSSPVVTVTRLTTSGNTTGALLTAVAQTPPVAALASLPPSGSAALTPLPCADAVSVPSPLSSTVGCAVNSRSTCLAQGCKVQGTLEGLMTHWNEIHEVERVLWLCPLTGCNLKFGHVNQVEVHLRRRHHISRPGVRRILNEVPPLADFVANKKYQFPGVSRPLYFAVPEVPHGALGHLLKGTVQGQVETILQSAKAVSLPGPQSLAMPRQVLPLPVNTPSAGMPWRIPLPPPTTSGPRLLPPLATSGPRMLPPLASSDPRMLLPLATSGPKRMLPPAISGPRVPRGPPPAISGPQNAARTASNHQWPQHAATSHYWPWVAATSHNWLWPQGAARAGSSRHWMASPWSSYSSHGHDPRQCSWLSEWAQDARPTNGSVRTSSSTGVTRQVLPPLHWCQTGRRSLIVSYPACPGTEPGRHHRGAAEATSWGHRGGLRGNEERIREESGGMPCSQAPGGFPGIGNARVREGQPLHPTTHHCRPSPIHRQHQGPSASTESGPHCSLPHDRQRPRPAQHWWPGPSHQLRPPVKIVFVS